MFCMFIAVWGLPVWIGHIFFYKQLVAAECAIDSFGTLLMSVAFAPFIWMIYIHEYRCYWIRVNFESIQELLKTWNICLYFHPSTYDSNSYELSWRGTDPEGRVRRQSYTSGIYKMFKSLEKMSVHDWSLIYLPYTEKYKNKYNSKTKLKPFKEQ